MISKEGDKARATVFRLARYEILRAIGDQRGESEGLDIAKLAMPEDIRCRRVYEIQLAALGDVFVADVLRVDLVGLDEAIAHCSDSLLPAFLLIKGRTLLARASTREEIIRATWPLMRVVIHMPDDPLAADGLYYTAGALERLGRADKAGQLLEECLQHEGLRSETRDLAEAALGRVRAGGS